MSVFVFLLFDSYTPLLLGSDPIRFFPFDRDLPLVDLGFGVLIFMSYALILFYFCDYFWVVNRIAWFSFCLHFSLGGFVPYCLSSLMEVGLSKLWL